MKKKIKPWQVLLIVIGGTVNIIFFSFLFSFIGFMLEEDTSMDDVKAIIATNNVVSSEQILKDYIKEHSTDPQGYILYAENLIKQEKYEEAVTYLAEKSKEISGEDLSLKKQEIETKYAEQIENERQQKAEAQQQYQEEIKQREEQQKKEQEDEKKQYYQSCQEINYKDLLRTPEKYKNQRIKLKVKISQIMSGGLFDSGKYYRCYSDNEGHDFYFDDEYLIRDDRIVSDPKLLVDDIITIYGEFDSLEKVERALTNTNDELPKIKMKYVEIIEQ